MTTYEHAMLGVSGALAAGLYRRYGWQIAALAAVAAGSPDWDGRTGVLGRGPFAGSHRAWGHNLLVAGLLGAFLGVLDYRYDISSRLERLGRRLLRLATPAATPDCRKNQSLIGYSVWAATGLLAGWSHL